jgi:predicted secreted protein
MKWALMASVILLITATHKTATMPVGETVIIELQDIATTGYRWQVEGVDPAVVTLQKEDTIPGTAPGAAGVRRLEFLAVGAGHVTLRFNLRRPWETNVPPIKQTSLDLTVK